MIVSNTKEKIPRIDDNVELRKALLPYCRLKRGEIWKDPFHKHKVGCLDAANENDVKLIMENSKAMLAIQDPPYNIIVGNSKSNNLNKTSLGSYIDWCEQWVKI